MRKYRNINKSIFPIYAIKFIDYRLYVDNLSEFTVYGDCERLKSFLRYVLCSKKYKNFDLNFFYSISDFTKIPLSYIKHFNDDDMLSYISFLSNVVKLSDQTKHNYIITVKTFYYYLYKKFNYTKFCMFDDLAVPKYRQKSVSYLSIADCNKLLSSISDFRDKAIVYLLLNTGARRCEIADALFCDLDLQNRVLKVLGKGNREGFLYLNDISISVLSDYLTVRPSDKSDYLFLSRNGCKIDYNDVYRIVKKYLLLAGLDTSKYSTHKLRHTFATLLYQQGADLRLLQELLRHSNIDTTKRYTHIDNSSLHDTVNNFVLNK